MNTNQPHRQRPLRLAGYDYTQAGAYFVTMCTRWRIDRFGKIRGSVIDCSPIGELAAACWHAIPEHYFGVQLDEFVVMPNHVHGLIMLPGGGAGLGTILGTYKAAVTRQAHRSISPAPATIWHVGYHDHVVRDQASLQRIRRYIRYNPTKWQRDRLQLR